MTVDKNTGARTRVVIVAALALIAVLAYQGYLRWQSLWWDVAEPLPKQVFLIALYSFSWLMLPWMAACVVAIFRCKGLRQWIAVLMLLPLALLSYGRFIEPNLLFVERHPVKAPFDAKVALIADVHVGIYSTPAQLQRLVERLNSLDLDEIWVAGDWSNRPPLDMKKAFAPLKQLRHPVFSVPGNHDAQRPGPPVQGSLREVLQSLGVEYLENRIVEREHYSLLGLGSAWAFEAHYALVSRAASNKPLIVLAHNPDVANFLPKPAFLTVAGHTHGGQVDLPWITRRVLNNVTMAGVDEGWYKTPAGMMFVTRGIGMVGLPVRFGNVPVIDVIEFSADAEVPEMRDAMKLLGPFRGW